MVLIAGCGCHWDLITKSECGLLKLWSFGCAGAGDDEEELKQ